VTSPETIRTIFPSASPEIVKRKGPGVDIYGQRVRAGVADENLVGVVDENPASVLAGELPEFLSGRRFSAPRTF